MVGAVVLLLRLLLLLVGVLLLVVVMVVVVVVVTVLMLPAQLLMPRVPSRIQGSLTCSEGLALASEPLPVQPTSQIRDKTSPSAMKLFKQRGLLPPAFRRIAFARFGRF